MFLKCHQRSPIEQCGTSVAFCESQTLFPRPSISWGSNGQRLEYLRGQRPLRSEPGARLEETLAWTGVRRGGSNDFHRASTKDEEGRILRRGYKL